MEKKNVFSKSVFSISLIALLLFAGVESVEAAFAPSAIVCGDVNGDGQVTVLDVSELSRALVAGSVPYSSCVDVNKDGVISTLDLLRFQQYFSGGALLMCPASCGPADIRWVVETGSSPYTLKVSLESTSPTVALLSPTAYSYNNLCIGGGGYLYPTGPNSGTGIYQISSWTRVGSNYRVTVLSNMITCAMPGMQTRFRIDSPIGAPYNAIRANDVLSGTFPFALGARGGAFRVDSEMTIATASSCLDSDAGSLRYYGSPGNIPSVAGTVVYDGQSAQDACIFSPAVNGTVLREYFCSNTTIPGPEVPLIPVMKQDWKCLWNCTAGACQ